jgi:hypothetical protein
MAHIFAITSAVDTVPLDGRRGEITFTVTNSTGRPLRGRAVAIPLGNTKKEWLTLGGESERDFSSTGTQQFTVNFVAPPDAAPGKYPFRLDVLSVVNPDEDFTEGPAVTAEIGASPLPPPKPSFPKWIIPVVLLVLLVGGVLTWFALRDNTPPSVEVVATPTATATPTPFNVTSVKVDATPYLYYGPCPVPIKFHAQITANGPGIIQYQVIRSDGVMNNVLNLTVPQSGVADLHWVDYIGTPGQLFEVTEWVTIYSPNTITSNQFQVRGGCL